VQLALPSSSPQLSQHYTPPLCCYGALKTRPSPRAAALPPYSCSVTEQNFCSRVLPCRTRPSLCSHGNGHCWQLPSWCWWPPSGQWTFRQPASCYASARRARGRCVCVCVFAKLWNTCMTSCTEPRTKSALPLLYTPSYMCWLFLYSMPGTTRMPAPVMCSRRILNPDH
jgi:hypothetical protein